MDRLIPTTTQLGPSLEERPGWHVIHQHDEQGHGCVVGGRYVCHYRPTLLRRVRTRLGL
jgi:hypothetical protein